MIELLLPNKESLPTNAAYSQHYDGEKKSWSEISKEGTHPKVYIEKGGHPSFFTGGSEYTIRWDYNYDYDILLLSTQKWLRFRGVWGADGWSPYGPVFRCSRSFSLIPKGGAVGYMWIDPIYWSEEL